MTGNVEKFVTDMFADGFREVEKGIYVKATRGAVRVVDTRESPFTTRLMYPNGQTGAEAVIDPSETDYRAWIRTATTGQVTAEFTSRVIRFVIIAAIVIGLLYFLKLMGN
jgi:hypothetical protein